MLEAAWFFIWVLLWAVYFMLDGFDLGLGALMPVLARNEQDRKTLLNSIGPFWDGNEVWLITAGAVTFAAFPGAYATMFSALYSPFILLLFALILRGAALGLRPESETTRARRAWDALISAGSLIAAILFGVAFGNIFKGIPINERGVLQGNMLSLLSPYALLCGALFLAAFSLHGCLWLSIKSQGDVEDRAKSMAKKLWFALLVAALAFMVSTWLFTGIFSSYLNRPGLLVVPAIVLASLFLVMVYIKRGAWIKAFASSGVFIMSAVFFGMTGIYPSLIPSSMGPAFSVTIQNASASPLSLKIMLGVVMVFIPLVIAYQAWAYYIFREKAGTGQGHY